MKLSLVIPCTHRDVTLVPRLLRLYAEGTVKPDQVVVSVSNAHMADTAVLEEVARVSVAAFDEILVLKHQRRMMHGPNRQAGSERALHDIICYQDADDIPHPQRIELVKLFFSRDDILHLNHTFCEANEAFSAMTEHTSLSVWRQEAIFIQSFPTGRLRDCAAAQATYGHFTKSRVHAGQPAIHRSVLSKVRWKDWKELAFGIAEDYEFCMECVFTWRKSLIIDLPLIRYTPFAGRETPEEMLGLVPPSPAPK